MLSKRVRVSGRLEQRLSSFYHGKVCVVTGSGLAVDWAHVEEDPTRTDFASVIPLSSELNQAMARHRKGILPFSLSSDHLRSRSIELDEAGLYYRSYACAKLGSYLAVAREGNPDAGIDLATVALNQLRSLDQPQLAASVLYDCVQPILHNSTLASQVSTINKSKFAGVIAAHFQERGDSASFLDWFSLSLTFLQRAERTSTCLKTQDQLSRLWTFHLITNRSPEAESFTQKLASSRLLSAHRLASTANAFWQVQAARKLTGLDAALETLDRIERAYGRIEPHTVSSTTRFPFGEYSLWILGAFLQGKASLAMQTGRHEESMAFADTAYNLYLQTGCRPIPTATSDAMRQYYNLYRRTCDEPIGLGLKPRSAGLKRAADRVWREQLQAP